MNSQPTVVLVSYHYFESKRKAGFHWLADAYRRLGWNVVFVTAPVSWISWLRRDPRFAYPLWAERHRIKAVDDRLSSFVLFTPFHASNLRVGLLNRVAAPLFRRYERAVLGDLEDHVRRAELVVFESTPALLLYPRFRRLNEGARFVYRVSDDVRLLGLHPLVEQVEHDVAPEFDLVSVPSEYLYRRFADLPNVVLQYHGIDKEAFDEPTQSPYRGGVNACFIGNSHFDGAFYAHAAAAFRDWKFHVIGAVRADGAARLPNVVFHGEMPFADTIPYVQHADVGLQTRVYEPGAESLTDSLKMQQYTYCALPIVAPAFLRTARPNVFYYAADDPESIRVALANALASGRHEHLRDSVPSWDEVAAMLATGAVERVAQ